MGIFETVHSQMACMQRIYVVIHIIVMLAQRGPRQAWMREDWVVNLGTATKKSRYAINYLQNEYVCT